MAPKEPAIISLRMRSIPIIHYSKWRPTVEVSEKRFFALLLPKKLQLKAQVSNEETKRGYEIRWAHFVSHIRDISLTKKRAVYLTSRLLSELSTFHFMNILLPSNEIIL